eukprot:c19285_g2_i1.p1 GENE.c19285_g2_i1~~c19285_g2_i1.p1  ORF type:complete len:351 (+),score=69.00 c19285_g2_i1:29-1081(+)
MKKNRGFWTVFIFLVILVRVDGIDILSDEHKDRAEKFLCQTIKFRCPQGKSRMEQSMENLNEIDFKQIVDSFKTLGGTRDSFFQHFKTLPNIKDADWDKFKKKLEGLRSEYRRLETEAFSAVLTTKEFCSTSSIFITDLVTDTINGDVDFAKLKLDSMRKRLSDSITHFSLVSDLLSRVEEESSELSTEAGRLSEKYLKKSSEIPDKGSADWVNYAVILGTVVGCVATGGILNPLCVGGVASSFGSSFATKYYDDLNEEEKKKFMQQSDAYKTSKKFLLEIIENLKLYEKKLEVFHNSVDDAGTMLLEFGGAYYGKRASLKSKAEKTSMYLESVAELLTEYIETELRHLK